MDVRAFAEACAALPNPSAEALLASIKSSPWAIPFAREVIALQTHSINVRFQAALILRDAAIRQHESLPMDRRLELRRWTLLMGASSSEPAMRATLIQACALMWKRAWLEIDSSELEPVARAQELLSQGSEAGALLLKSLVLEFSSSKASSIGLSVEFHRRCCRAFEACGIRECFAAAFGFLAAMALPPALRSLARTLVDVMEQCLAWPFAASAGAARLFLPVDAASADAMARSAALRVAPGPAWSALLLGRPEPFATLAAVYASVRHVDADLAVAIRQPMLNLASLAGDVFASDEQHAQYGARAFAWACELLAAPRDDDEVVDACWTVARALSTAPPAQAAADGAQVRRFAELTVALLQSRGVGDFLECVDALLHVWVQWATFAAAPSPLVPSHAQAPQTNLLRASCAHVFQALVLAFSSRLGDDDDDDDLANAASVGRVDAPAALALLSGVLDETAAATAFDALERRVYALQLLGFVLADSAAGEAPVVPTQLEPHAGAVVQASFALLRAVQAEVAMPKSPLLLAEALRATERWAATYLNPSPALYEGRASSYGSQRALPPALADAFAGPRGLEIADALVEAATRALAAGEPEPEQASVALLATLVRHCVRPGQRLRKLDALAQLQARALGDADWRPLDGLNAEPAGQLARVLFSVVDTDEDFAVLATAPVSARMQQLAASRRARTWARDARRFVEVAKGLSGSSSLGSAGTRVRALVIDLLPLVVDMGTYAAVSPGCELVLAAVLGFLAEFAETHLVFVESAGLPAVFLAARAMAECWGGRANPFAGVDDAGAQEAVAADVCCILRVLIALSDRASLDLSADHGGDVAAAAEGAFDPAVAVLSAVDLVLPLVRPELLGFAGVTEKYFELVGALCHSRPGHVLGLAPRVREPVLASLRFGMAHYDARNERRCLECVASLAQHAAQHPGSVVVATATDVSEAGSGVLQLLASSVLTLLVYSASEHVEAAAWALYCLARCPGVLEGACRGLVEGEKDAFVRSRIAEALGGLGAGVSFTAADRADRRRFSTNVGVFVETVRGFAWVR